MGSPDRVAGVEAAAVDLQDLDDLPADLVDELAGGGPAGGDGRGRAQHAVEVALFPAGPGLFATAPEGHLGDRGADEQEQHGGLDVGAVGDVEGVVRLGEEVVEASRAREGCHDAGQPDAGRAAATTSSTNPSAALVFATVSRNSARIAHATSGKTAEAATTSGR